MDTAAALASVGMEEKGDETLLVMFFIEPVENKAKSIEEGRPIFEDVEHISIRSGGSRDERRRPARDADKTRFPRHYAAFKARTTQEIMSGTPLTEWTGCTRSQVEELKFLNILTVEQVAGVSDQNAQSMRGLVTLKQSAQKYLEAATGSVEIQALREENQSLLERLEALEAAAEEKPRRKRRSKAEMEAAKANMTIDLDSTKSITSEGQQE
jgi:hypothetical protein